MKLKEIQIYLQVTGGERGMNNMNQFFGEALEIVENPEEFAKTHPILFNSTAIVYLTMLKGSPMWSVYDLGAFRINSFFKKYNFKIY